MVMSSAALALQKSPPLTLGGQSIPLPRTPLQIHLNYKGLEGRAQVKIRVDNAGVLT